MFTRGSYLIVEPSYESSQVPNTSIASSLRLSTTIVLVAVILALLLVALRPSRHQASVNDAAMLTPQQAVPHR